MKVSHLSGPISWVITCCLSRSELELEFRWELMPGIKPKTFRVRHTSWLMPYMSTPSCVLYFNSSVPIFWSPLIFICACVCIFTGTIQAHENLGHTLKWVAWELSCHFLTGWENTKVECLPHRILQRQREGQGCLRTQDSSEKFLVSLPLSSQGSPHLLAITWEVLSSFLFFLCSPDHFANKTSLSATDSCF